MSGHNVGSLSCLLRSIHWPWEFLLPSFCGSAPWSGRLSPEASTRKRLSRVVTVPAAPGRASRTVTETRTRKGSVLPPTRIHCRRACSNEFVNWTASSTQSRPLGDTDSCFRFSFDGEDRLLIHSFLVLFNPGGDLRIIDQPEGFHFSMRVSRCLACAVIRSDVRTPNVGFWYTSVYAYLLIRLPALAPTPVY